MAVFLKLLIIVFGFILITTAFAVPYLNRLSTVQRKSEIKIGDQIIVAEVVKSKTDKEKGLSGRGTIGVNEGMLFLFDKEGSYGFWMKGMKFPIDIIWIWDDEIVGFEENIDPQIGAIEADLKFYYPPEPVDKVLELKAGRVGSLRAGIGDAVKIRPLIQGINN